MKKEILQKCKHGYKNIILLLILIMSLSATRSFAQLSISYNNNNLGIACVGDVTGFTLNNWVFGVTYTWTTTPANQSTITYVDPYHVNIQWLSPFSNHTITVTGSDITNAWTAVCVMEPLDPFITTTNEVICQIANKEPRTGNILVDDENGCMNVCEYSTVSYHANSMYPMYPLSQNISRFEWTVVGGTFQPGGYTTITNSTFITDPKPNVTVAWGPAGSGSITVREISYWGCPTKEKTICIAIIESPRARFTIDSIPFHDLPPDRCYDICQGQTVSFQDLSTASFNSPIFYWEWNFGDGSIYSADQNPVHTYDTPGEYKVKLKVTNKCGCTSIFERRICVSETHSPEIYCPSVVCENHTDVYGTHTQCQPYTWTIIGGTQQLPQVDPEISITWDHVGADGFGYISLNSADCEGNCPGKSTVRVPVIQTIGTIAGPTIVCEDSYYRFKLPAWPATDFTWELIDNGTNSVINSPAENGNEIEVHTGNHLGSFTLNCSYVNTVAPCSGTATIHVILRLKPVIVAPERICVGSVITSPVTCSVSNPPAGSGVTKWTVIKPNGSTSHFNSASGSSSYTFAASLFNVSGNYTLSASNPAVFCDPELKTIHVVDPPTRPTEIMGEKTVCLNYPYTYTVGALVNTVVNWNITGGYVSGNPGATTAAGNSVSVIWTSPGGSLSASRGWDDIAACDSAAFSVSINQIVVSGNISGPDSVCEDGSANFYLDLNNGVIGETYEWSVDFPDKGSITSGQGTTGYGIHPLTVTFNHLVGFPNCTINCKITKCGVSTIISLPVTILTTTSITSLTPHTTSICSDVLQNNGVTFHVTTSGAPAASYIWDFGDGTPPQTTNSSTSPTYYYTNFGLTNQLYTVSVKVVSTCNMVVSADSFAIVTVHPQPLANISPGGLTLVCPPTDPFSIPTTISSNGTAYQWYFDQDGPLPAKIINGAGITYNITNNPFPNVSPAATSSFGQYWIVATNTYGCSTKTNISTILPSTNCITCNPVGPAGITNCTATLTACGTISATCTTLGTYPVNITGPAVWTLNSNGVPYTETGTSGYFNSPVYTLSQPGNYTIQIDVPYENSIPGNPPCHVIGYANVVVPVIANFTWGMVCAGNAGYDLTLTDNSPVYGNNPVTSRVWKINGVTVGGGSATYTQTMVPPYLGTIITVELTVNNGSAFPCVKTENIAIPNLPDAQFTTVTTNVPDHTKTCEGREVSFKNDTYPVPDINVWDFGDNTSLHAFDAAKVYTYSSPATKTVILTVTDKYGCWDTKSYDVTIDRNLLSSIPSNNSFYTLNPVTPPCYAPGQFVRVTVNPGISGNPNAWQWYSDNHPLTNSPSTVNYYDAYAQGPYWVQLRDNNYCYLNVNPAPAVVTFKYPVQAVITGGQDFCEYVDFSLKGPFGTSLNYSWVRVIPGNPPIYIPCGNSRVMTDNKPAGNYTYQLTVTGVCTSVSGLYNVTVHPPPAQPVISVTPINCRSYSLQLTASGSGSNFNWSTGQTGATIHTNHGGPYRVWLTNQYGCESYQDILVPLAPSTYFWRFPTGCYSYCPTQQPKQVNGPTHTPFRYWEWQITNNGPTDIVNPNGPWNGYGFHSDSDPLYLGLPPDGEGSGDYTWLLDNGLCKQQSDVMSVELKKECCEDDIRSIKVNCNNQTGDYDIEIDFTNNTPNCHNTSYNLSILNPGGTPSPYYFSSQSPALLVQGNNLILATIPGNPALAGTYTHVIIQIITLCNSWEHCIDTLSIIIPPCQHGKSLSITDAQTESNPISEFSIIPNPANTEVNISYRFSNNNAANSRTIQVYDVTARPVAEIKIANAAGSYKLDVNKYAQGVYFVEIRENNKHLLTKKMIINH